MRRWLPSYADTLAAFHLVAAATLCTSVAFSAETSWDPSGATLSAQIMPQDFDLPFSAFEMISRGAIIDAPHLKSAQPTPPKTQTSSSTQSQQSKPITSPFTKWVSPKTSANDQDEAPPADSPAPTPPTPTPKEVAPKVARRIPPKPSPAPAQSTSSKKQSTPSDDATPPSPPTPSTKSNSSTKSKKETTKKQPSVQAEPLTVKGFPTPVAELTAKPAGLDPANLKPLTSGQQRLRAKIQRTLDYYSQRPLNTRDRSPWEMMHALLAYEVDSKILRGGPKGEPTSAVSWLCFNQDCKRRTLMYVNEDGEMRVRVGPALQGHRGQLLSMLAQAKVSKDYPIRIEGHEFTVGDLVKMEMRTCYPRTELTFKLIGLMHYLDSDVTWVNDQGMEWSIPRLIAEEMRQPIRGAACGGTHRLSGLTLAYKTREQRDEPVDGEYLKAKKFATRYQQYAYRLQNRDGSLSTEWFRGQGNERDIDRKLKTTGHLLEWLLYAASDKELKYQRTANAANYLATTMLNNRYKDWEAGPLGHAIHALLLYDRLVFSHYDEPQNHPVAGKSKRTADSGADSKSKRK